MKKSLIASAIILSCSMQAQASQLYFSGNSIANCAIYTTNSGVLAADGSQNISSFVGSPGQFVFDTNSPNTYNLKVEAPNTFTSSPTLGFAPTFDVFPTITSGSMSGSIFTDLGTYSELAITQQGQNTVSVNFLASSASSNDSFPVGFYEAYVDITCF